MTGLTTRLRLPPWAQDLLLAGFVILMHSKGTQTIADSAGAAMPDGLGYGLLVATGAVLLVRRRWPVPVFAATAVASVWYYVADYPDGPGWVALFVAAYTVTAYGDGRRSIWIAGGVILGLTLVWLLTAELAPLIDAGWVFFRIGTVAMAAALGESVRTRRVIAVEAQERAERAEQTREEEARRRVDAERLRIAREVHDTVAHAIATVNIQAGVTAHVLDQRPAQAREALVAIEQTSARALRELRTTLGVLRDVDEQPRTPGAGLARLPELATLAREAGLDIAVAAPAPPADLPGAVDAAAYRILQESLTNVIRHAAANRVRVVLDYLPDALEIRVTDDGRGPAGTDPPAGHGIAGMRERCVLLGGELTASGGPDGGFQVRARLPLGVPAPGDREPEGAAAGAGRRPDPAVAR